MKTNSNAATRNSSDPNHPPLACDAQGNPIAVPEGTASWLLKRETGGRPRTIVGADKQPVRFQLDMTTDEIEAMLGAGTYRVYALTDVGETIDYVTTVVVGAGGDRSDATSALGKSDTRGPSSDLRFALETIMQMARAQSESLRAVSEAQADWVKGLATAKALPRNAAWTPQLPPPPPPANDDDDEEEDDEDEGPAMPPWLEVINNMAPALQTYGEILKMRFSPPAAPPRNAAPEASSGPNAMIHLAEINARVTPVERKYLNLVLRGSDGSRITELLLGSSVDEAVEWLKYQVASVQAESRAQKSGEAPPPPAGDFMTHVMAGAAFLTAEERAAVMWLLPKFKPVRIEELKTQLLAMTPQDAASWIRDNLEALRAEVAS